MSISVTDVVSEKALLKALFEFSSSLSDQALVVSLVSMDSALNAGDDFAAQAHRLLSTCFASRGPFLLRLSAERVQQINAFRKALKSNDMVAAKETLNNIRRAVIDEIDTHIMPEFCKRSPPKKAVVDSFDEVLCNPDYLAFFALFALKYETSRQALSQFSLGNGNMKNALSEDCWGLFKESDAYSTMVITNTKSRSTLRALRMHPSFQGLITATTNLERKVPPAKEKPHIDSIVECLWKTGSPQAEVVSVYPKTDETTMSSITTFCFPVIKDPAAVEDVRAFAFVLTRSDGTRRYACCQQTRHADGIGAVCVISTSPEYQLMKEIVEKSDFAEMQALISNMGERPERDLPEMSDINVSIIFQLMHPLRIMSLLEAVILEQKVLLLSSQLNILSMVGETIRWLLSPFQISAVYIPVLPNSLIETLHCPTSFLIGMHTSVMNVGIDLASIDMLCVADLDNDRVWSVGSSQRQLPVLPVSIRAPILHALRRVCFGRLVDIDFRNVYREITIEEWRTSFQKALQDLLLFEMKRFVVAVPDLDGDEPNRIVAVFDAPAFLSTKPKSWYAFLHAFFSTAGFSSFLSQTILPAR